MPKLGQAMTEGTVVEWHARAGDRVEAGALLVTIETDKSTYELDATASGVLTILVGEGEEVGIGTVIGQIGEQLASAAASRPAATGPAAPAPGAKQPKTAAGGRPPRVIASPKARRLAQELGVDLASVTPSDGEMVSADDVEAAAAAGETAEARRRETGRSPLTGLRRTAARRLKTSWQTIPHIVQMVDVDARALLASREAAKARISDVTVNDILLHTAARVMASLPELNVSFTDDEQVVSYAGVDIGFAVESPRGLVVPVIRGADRLELDDLVTERKRLVDSAQSGNLRAEDAGDASLTVSNLGMHGIRAGTPVINPGEPLLVFAGAIENRAVADGDRVVVRRMMTLSIAYDHRLLDGVAAARYSTGLKDSLESLAPGDETTTASEDGGASGGAIELTANSGGDGYAVTVQAGSHSWSIDEPEHVGGTNTGPDPVRAFLGALAACMVIAFKASARRRGIPVEEVTAGISSDGPVPSRIEISLSVASSADVQSLEKLAAAAKRTCRVSALLKPEVEVEVALRITEPHH